MSEQLTLDNTKKRVGKYFLYYTIGFAVLALGVFIWYILNGRTLIWQVDSWTQHYKALIYYGQYLRSILRTLVTEYKLIIPRWDISIGEGGDILQTFNYYGIGDPFYLLVALVPSKYCYIYYEAMIILRLYVAGLSFTWMYIQIKGEFPKNRVKYVTLLIFALGYAFCFWNIYNAARHPFFINPTIYLPLIIGGVELFIKKQKYLPLVLSIFFCGISNLYFFYIVAVLTVVYVVVRLLPTFKVDFGQGVRTILGIALCAIMAVLLGAIILFPVSYAFLSDSRTGIAYSIDLFYSKAEYLSMLKLFVHPGVDDYWVCGGFGIIGVICLVALLLQKGHTRLKICWGLAVIALCFPIIAHFINAMGYVSNRWIWVIALLVAYTGVEILPPLLNKIEDSRYRCTLLAVLACIMFVTIFYNSYRNNAPSKDNYVSTCVAKENVYSSIAYCDATILDNYRIQSGDTEFSRYETKYKDYNNSIIYGLSTPQYYWTLSNASVTRFREKILTRNAVMNVVDGYDDRLIPDAMSDIKYYILPKGGMPALSTMTAVATDQTYDVYLNPYNLGISYSYDSLISESDWQEENVLRREELMLQKMVVNDEKAADAETIVSANEGIDTSEEIIGSIGPGKITSDGSYVIDIPLSKNTFGETVAVVKGLDFEGNNTNVAMEFGTNAETYNNIDYRTNKDQYYHGIHDFCVNLRCNESPISSVPIKLSTPGVYSFESIEIICHPTESVISEISSLKSTGMTNVKVDTDCVSGDIDVQGDDIYLCMAVPFSKGWKAYVDGNETDVFNANIKYMGIKVNQGRHSIEFKYKTPLYSIGLIVSLITLIGLCVALKLRK